jgi:crotonobetainyl-CoA:carnitine CoA-transferase CaiB-like acyl-CoA transferase
VTTPAHLPLTGIRVVDLTSNVAAPWAGAVLADLGADVVHVEGPAGDDSRRMAPRTGSTSAYFHVVNRNKAFRRLDLREHADRAELDGLIAGCDVLVTNLRPGKLARHGLDAATLGERHPRLIHAALSAYGEAGPERDRAGYDAVLQARTGVAQVTGTADGPPVRAGVSLLDVGAGTWLALAVISALLARERTGRGGAVSTSLFETGATWVAYHVAAHEVSGRPSGRHGSGHPAFAPYGIFPTADGQLCLGVGGDELFRRLCAALPAPHLLDDPRYRTNADRVQHADALRADLQAVLAGMTAQEASRRLAEADLPGDVLQSPEELLDDPQACAVGMFVDARTAGGRVLRFPGLPISFDGVRPSGRPIPEPDPQH